MINCWQAADDPQRTFAPLEIRALSLTIKQSNHLLLRLGDNNDKIKLADRRGRKATGSRFLREAMDDLRKNLKIAETNYVNSWRIAIGQRITKENR